MLTVLIASPLEPAEVARIVAMAPDRVRVIHEPALLPTPLYVADHHGRRPNLTEADLARWRSLLSAADVLFDFDWLEPEQMPHNAPRLRWVQGTSAGIGEFIRAMGLERSEITFTTAAGVHAIPLSEFVILGLLYLTKNVPWLKDQQARHVWQRYTSEQLAGKRALVIGLGNVGREIALKCARLGVEVLAMRASAHQAPEGVTSLVKRHELLDVLPSVDALVLSVPHTSDTDHLIGRREFAALPHSAVLVNVSRGALVDEPELVAALREGRLAGAALDVFEHEPLPADSPLWDMPNVLISPHSASTVAEENHRIVDLFVDNLGRYLEGRPLRNVYVASRGY
jgi:phosphoglycerate dehydrogenase-like enzyme